MAYVELNLSEIKKRCNTISNGTDGGECPQTINISIDFVLDAIELIEALEEDRMEDAVDKHQELLSLFYPVKVKRKQLS